MREMYEMGTDERTARSFPALLGYGAAFSVVMSAYGFTGGSLAGRGDSGEEDGYARKEALRKNRRRPITETLEELGEGRGWWPRFLEPQAFLPG